MLNVFRLLQAEILLGALPHRDRLQKVMGVVPKLIVDLKLTIVSVVFVAGTLSPVIAHSKSQSEILLFTEAFLCKLDSRSVLDLSLELNTDHLERND